jgi:hypothetical protein
MYGKDFMLCITYAGCQTNMRLKDLDSPDGPKSSTCASYAVQIFENTL